MLIFSTRKLGTLTLKFGEGNTGALLSLGLLSIVTQNQRIPFRSLGLLL